MKLFRLSLVVAAFSAAAPAFAAETAFSWFATTADQAAAPPPRAPRLSATAQARCRDIEVDLDEGYGVSGTEMRQICDVIP
jgi:hypothetical protein